MFANNEATGAGAVVVDTSHSDAAFLHAVPIGGARITGGFWNRWRTVCREATIPTQHHYLFTTGRIDNFLRVAGKSDKEFVGPVFNDSDVYKWLEAASWSLASDPDPALDALCDEVVEIVAGAQHPDGYLNTFYSRERESERWSNLRDNHELYCAGHFIQAAVAHRRATGKTGALDIAVRLADCIDAAFGDGPGKRRLVDGHEEIEMALVELSRDTGERRYFDLAKFFIDTRGAGTIGSSWLGRAYFQDDVPIRQMTAMDGHAVRAMYYMCGAADIALETGEAALREALERLWANMTERRMYISGGLGARWEGEAFGADYELPNARAYAESCAAIGSAMWNWRMLHLSGDARYADLMEHTLYNAVLPGISLDGREYFYQNPLADVGSHRRAPWFGCACCPPNIARMLTSLPGYVYSKRAAGDGVWVHLYATGSVEIDTASGKATLHQTTDYPWDGDIEIAVEAAPSSEFSIMLRIPEWAGGASVSVDGGEPLRAEAGGYFEARRVWKAGDRIRLSLPMKPRRLVSHPYVMENAGRTALTIGPLLYCFEQTDNPDLDVAMSAVDLAKATSVQFDPQALSGVAVASVPGISRAVPGEWSDRLTHEAPRRVSEPEGSPAVLRAVPYFAWANREPGPMQVWMLDRAEI